VIAQVVYREISLPAEAAAADAVTGGETDADGGPPADSPQPVVADERRMLVDSTDDRAAAPGAVPDGHRQLTVTLSYTGAGIAAAAAVMLLASAFLAGKHLSRPKYGPTGPTLAQVRDGRAFPDVLNVGSASPKASVESIDGVESAAGDGIGGSESPPPRIVSTPRDERADGAPSPPPIADARRVAGRNYIIAQSYPDRETADKAADLLNRNNIPVTVEQLDYAPNWFCVVTRVGFDRVKAPEYERYEKLIRDANAQAAAARMKKYDPYPYKWK
jgi:hypothetical protein